MKKIFIASVLIFSIVLDIQSVFAEEPAETGFLEELIDEAVNNNPGLKALEEKVNVFKERPSQAGSLDDPRIRLSILNLPVDSFSFAQESMTQKQVAVMQKFPFPGKLSLRIAMAEQELKTVKEEYAEKRNDLITQVKVVYHDFLFTVKSIDISEDNRELLREFVKIAETKYAVGTGLQQDILKAQVELSRMNDRLIILKQKRKTLEARLNTLLNRPVQMPFSGTGGIKQTAFDITFENLQKVAEENRPVLLGLKHMIERSRLAYSLAERNYYPDPDVGVSFGQRDDGPAGGRSELFSAFVTFNIPLWRKSKEDRKAAEEKANIRRITQQYNSMRNNVFFQIKKILVEIEKYNQKIELFKTGLIPQSRASLKSAISGYTVNKVNFLTLVDNQTILFNYEIDYYNAITNYENKLAELETAVGKRLLKK